MKRLLPIFVLVATGCGSTGTEAGGDDDDSVGTPFTCTSFQQGAGIICDSTTNPPTIRVDFGPNAGQAVEGPTAAGLNPNKGRYISSFTPSATEAPLGGLLIKNPATNRIGVRAIDELCKTKNPTFAGAHMCSNEELIENVRAGFLTAPATGAAMSANDRSPGTNGSALNSFRGSCAGFTYNSADLFYQGTRWTVSANDPKDQVAAANENTDAVAINFEGSQPCGTLLPIACCQ